MKFSKTTGCFYPDDICYTSLPTDLMEVTQDDYIAAMSRAPGTTLDMVGGKLVIVPAPAPTPEQVAAALVQSVTAAVQQRLDAFARSRNYDNILSACSYATSTVPKFKSEGQACVTLRDATWAAAYTVLDKVQAGKRPMPSGIADIEADLPALEWPQ